ncbi:MAG TPA: hypothetical protein VJ719_02515, partial [Chthoniobacterales bacterium]|nr:hypothetical protein [Chthoniobacterales bacterium]
QHQRIEILGCYQTGSQQGTEDYQKGFFPHELITSRIAQRQLWTHWHSAGSVLRQLDAAILQDERSRQRLRDAG